MSEIPAQRLTFIDVTRTYAILLALLAHALKSIGFFHQLGSDALLIKQFTRMATPLFVFIFGFMIEFVYVKKAKCSGIDSIYNRILIRSFQCYIAYAIISLCAMIGGYKSLETFLQSLLFFSNSRFGNILRAYSILLLIVPFIIKLRIKFGVKSLFFSLILLIISYSYIVEYKTIHFGVLNHLVNILFGIGPHKGGPSVYGALSFMIAGMILASSFTEGDPRDKSRFLHFYFVAFLVLTICSILGFSLIKENITEAWTLFSSFTYRRFNAPAYYIVGIFGSVSTISLIYLLVGSRPLAQPLRYILPIGTSSLISYTTGNIILNLTRVKIDSVNPLLFLCLFFLTVTLITRNIHKIPYFIFFKNVLNLRFKR